MNSYELAEKLTGDTDRDIEMLTTMMLAERDRDAKRTILEMLNRLNDYAHLAELGIKPTGVDYAAFAVGDCLFEMSDERVLDRLAEARRGAEAGDAAAQYTLAMYILSGILGFPEYGEVVQLLEKSAEQGNRDALYELGVCYMNGEGVRNDSLRTEQLWKQAAALGNVDDTQYRGAPAHPVSGHGQHREASAGILRARRL